MTNETQPRDNELYDAVMAMESISENPNPNTWAGGYDTGYEVAAGYAARLAAARTPAPVVGEEALDFEIRGVLEAHWADYSETLVDDLIHAVRDAILAAQTVQVPEFLQIPEGWELSELATMDGANPSVYCAELISYYHGDWHAVVGEGPAWHDALRAAIEQAKGGDE